MRARHPIKRFCPLCKDKPMTRVSDYVFQCVRCAFQIDESRGQSAYHKHVLIAKPSIIGSGNKKKFYIADADTPSRHEQMSRINDELLKPTRYDKDSFLNPDQNLKPGKIGRTDLWMNVNYAVQETDTVSEDKQREFDRLLKTKKYSY